VIRKIFAVGIVVFVYLVMALQAGCAPDPRLQAEADAIRTRAAQDAADRVQARQNPAPVAAQQENSLPWILFFCSAGSVVASTLVLVATASLINRAGGRSIGPKFGPDTSPLQMRRTVIFVTQVGHGMYRLTDASGSCLLDVRDAKDQLLLRAIIDGLDGPGGENAD